MPGTEHLDGMESIARKLGPHDSSRPPALRPLHQILAQPLVGGMAQQSAPRLAPVLDIGKHRH